MHLISWGFRLVTGKEKAFCVFAGLTLGFLAVVHLPRPNQVGGRHTDAEPLHRRAVAARFRPPSSSAHRAARAPSGAWPASTRSSVDATPPLLWRGPSLSLRGAYS